MNTCKIDFPVFQCCNLCPRNCKIDRSAGQVGYCGANSTLKVARAALHMWEEPCLSGDIGSGTVFFSGCSLRCVFCQNYSIAHAKSGKEISINRLAEIFIELQEKGAANINLVTPTHFVPQIIAALDLAKQQGLSLPVIYNTGSYESIDTIKMLEGYIDIYLPDLKYVSSDLSSRYSNAGDYFSVAKAAIAEMYHQVKTPKIEGNFMKRGMIVRHLVLPGQQKDSKRVLQYLYETYHNNIYISIMNQYTPLPYVENFKDLNRRVTSKEYDYVVNYAINLGIENGFIQEGETAKDSFIPDFDNEGV